MRRSIVDKAGSEGNASRLLASASPVALSGSVLDLLTLSRGSSWHRCPMLRLMQRAQGRSCAGEMRGQLVAVKTVLQHTY
jgi:hypothetical protein